MNQLKFNVTVQSFGIDHYGAVNADSSVNRWKLPRD